MRCPRCGSENVTVQVVNEIELREKRHGLLWKIFVAWWWIPTKWLFFTGWAIILKLFRRRRLESVNKATTKCVCQNCGHTWNA